MKEKIIVKVMIKNVILQMDERKRGVKEKREKKVTMELIIEKDE